MSFDNISDVDRFGCSHPDDGEAAATEAGDLVVAALVSILPKSTSDDVVRTGRYVWRDGTLHRSPLGEGGQACQGPGDTFVAAPGGAATEVWILPARDHAIRASRWRADHGRIRRLVALDGPARPPAAAAEHPDPGRDRPRRPADLAGRLSPKPAVREALRRVCGVPGRGWWSGSCSSSPLCLPRATST